MTDPRNAVEVYPYGYRAWTDAEGHVVSLMPDPLAHEPVMGVFQRWVRPLLDIDAAVADIAAQLANVYDASGPALDLHGSWLGESRDGLGDEEYRRIIAGRLVAARRAYTVEAVIAGYRALTDAEDIELRKLGWSSVYLSGLVSWTPSDAYLVRAGRVVGDMVAPGGLVDAVLYEAGSVRWDTPVGWDAEPFAHAMRTPNATT